MLPFLFSQIPSLDWDVAPMFWEASAVAVTLVSYCTCWNSSQRTQRMAFSAAI